MPAAIDKGIYYAVAENFSNDIHFYSVDFDENFLVNIANVRRMEGWKNYVLGVVNELLILGKPITGLIVYLQVIFLPVPV